MRKKLAILGRGTAGCLSLAHFLRQTNWDIDLYYDPNIPQQTVGEGSQLNLPHALYNNLGFQHTDLAKLDGSFKAGIFKSGWGLEGKEFFHHFPPPSLAYHFNAVKLQEHILDHARTSSRFKVIEAYKEHSNIDADYILDCSGKPANYDDFIIADSIPVNSVHVTQCYWDSPKFQYTLTLARPYGWVFGIPLANRCSIGYMYNNNINTLDEVKEDVKEIFTQYNLVPSTTTNTFSFNNYYRKENYSQRVIYNGNASFFLEPIEATSIGLMNKIIAHAHGIWKDGVELIHLHNDYLREIEEIKIMMAVHYYAGSKWDTEFWRTAHDKAQPVIDSALNNYRFKDTIKQAETYKPGDQLLGHFGTWGEASWQENLKGLGIFSKIKGMIK